MSVIRTSYSGVLANKLTLKIKTDPESGESLLCVGQVLGNTDTTNLTYLSLMKDDILISINDVNTSNLTVAKAFKLMNNDQIHSIQFIRPGNQIYEFPEEPSFLSTPPKMVSVRRSKGASRNYKYQQNV